MVDTLFLSALAFPQRPYHPLAKPYKQVRSELSDPVADCHQTRVLLEECLVRLQWRGSQHRGLLSVYRSCLPGGTGLLLEGLGGRFLPTGDLVSGFLSVAEGRACPTAMGREVPRLLGRGESRPAVAFVLAWLLVAGTESVLPRWVHHRWPEATRLVSRIRGMSCLGRECGWCSEHHDLGGNLKRFFGFDFLPKPATADRGSLQERITSAVLAGKPLLAVMPTGSGKSLCYQLPAILRNEQCGSLTVVISPLQALMKDQVDNLNRRTRTPGLAATLNGLQTMPERSDTLEAIRMGRHALLYVSPEQLRSTRFERTIRQRQIAAWVFDEAHCIAKWGHEFRPDYLYAARFIREFSDREGIDPAPVACFTATARRDVEEEIRAHFGKQLDQKLVVLSGDRVDRDNLRYRVEELPAARKVPRIDELLTGAVGKPGRGTHTGSAIVYVSTRRRAEETAAALRKRGWPAEHFHGGMDAPAKKQAQERFVDDQTPVIVATNAFGMGIDKNNVRLVVHADLPASLENYLQEAGRGGRDGKPADCVLLFTKADLERQFDLLATNLLTKRDLAQILRAIRRVRRKGADEIVVSPGDLLRVPDTATSFAPQGWNASTQVKMAISWLEQAQFLVRDENRTRIFQGVPAVADPRTAAATMDRLRISRATRRRWEDTLELLYRAAPDDGIDIDHLAGLPSYRDLYRSLQARHSDPRIVNEKATDEIFSTLYQMASRGLLEHGAHFSAWIRHKIRDRSKDLLADVDRAQTALLDTIRADNPGAEAGTEIKLVVPRLIAGMRAAGLNVVSSDVLKLVGGWARGGFGPAPPVTVTSNGRSSMRLTLQVPWEELEERTRLRTGIGHVIVDTLGKKADEQRWRGERLILFSHDQIAKAVSQRTDLRAQAADSLNAINKTLLFLDEHQVIRLQHGLALFRQAMTIRLRPEAKGRRVSNSDYRPLQGHYQARVFGVHAIGRYVERAQTSSADDARHYVDRYFNLSTTDFRRRYFPNDVRPVERATSRETYQTIVEDLGNVAQQAVVTAAKDENLLVLAGPGSGKTRVVVHRCAYLLKVERIRPENILVVCFNRSAMYELRKRLHRLVGDISRRVAVHTYHSLALRLTERSITEEQVNQPHPADGINFDEIIDAANRRLRGEEPIVGVDSDDLRDRLLAGYEHVLVDEYQDIDDRQYEMITHIARRATNEDHPDRYATILAVGDDDQNIYEFRRASTKYIHQYTDAFNAKPHYLVENYRSTRHIINTANALISHNTTRIKTGHPIRINKARRSDPPGGAWEQHDPNGQGRVLHLEVDDGAAEARWVLARIEWLRTHSPNPDWHDYAVLARTHIAAHTVRAVLEDNGIPVRRVVSKGLPWPGRIRELHRLLNHLTETSDPDMRIPQLRDQIITICGARTAWTEMADRILADLETEHGPGPCPTEIVTEGVHRALAEHARTHIIGHGIYVGTAHSAKGLQFPHLIVAGGGWRKQHNRNDPQAERRLYYVAITRAQHTLTLINRRDDPLPYHPEIRTPSLHTRRGGVATDDRHPQAPVAYTIIGLDDIYLSYPGTKPPTHPIHQALTHLQAGHPATLRPTPHKRVQVLDNQRREIARLSATASQKWTPTAIRNTNQIRVLAIATRTINDEHPQYRNRNKTPQWEIPVLEVRH